MQRHSRNQHARHQSYFNFSKMHGLGNDFMVIDGVSQNVFLSPEQIKRLARRHYGVGFDQLLLVEPPYDPDLDFHYRIFNADGSEVPQCGNGARCFARFVAMKGLTNKSTIKVSTFSGKLSLKVERDGKVTVNMGSPIWEPKKVPFQAQKREKTYVLRIDDETIFCSVVSLGNPHCVIEVDDVNTAPVEKIGEALMNYERFPEGVNVGFMQVVRPDLIKLRVYERGAKETQACGSGACAAVVVGQELGRLKNKVRVDLKGGFLFVSSQGNDKPVYMTGPAHHVFDGKIKI